MDSTFINRKIEAASQHILQLEEELESRGRTIEYYTEKVQEQETTQANLQEELDNVEAFVLALRGPVSPPSREDLGSIIVELVRRADEGLSGKDVSEIVDRDRRTISNTMISLERRGLIKCVRQEKCMGRYPRKYYTVVDERVTGTT